MRRDQSPLLERAPFGGPQIGILDTNTIFNDLLYQLRHGREIGVLIRSAQEGAVRLFAATHVLTEVRERAVTQERRGFAAADLLALFERRYLPEICFVDVRGMPVEPRVLAVAKADPDDVPTAQLGLLLAPCHVYTDDPDLTEAGFGEARNWLQLARSAERTMQVDQTMLLLGALAKLGVSKLRARMERDFRQLRPIDLLLAGALGFAVLAVLPAAGHARLEQALNSGGRFLAGAGEIAANTGAGLLSERVRHGGYLAQTVVSAEATPTLERRIGRELALRGPRQAGVLAAVLSAEAAAVESVLRSRACFVFDQQGWRLGQHSVTHVLPS